MPEVLVIDSDGTKLGVISTQDALRRARDQGLNLVEVAPNSRPPVCRILDYGKYKYDEKQAQKRKKRNQVVVEVKEVKFRPKIEKHDFEFKLRHVGRFLSDGNKVKCTVMFRGREMAHTNLGELMLERVLGELEGKVNVEQSAKLEGRNMTMLIAPKVGAWPKKEKEQPEAARSKDGKRGSQRPQKTEAADGEVRAEGGEEAPESQAPAVAGGEVAGTGAAALSADAGSETPKEPAAEAS